MSRCPTCGSARSTWSRDTILTATRVWHGLHGRPPTSKEWKNAAPGHPAQSSVTKVFGTWNAMITAAGFEARPNNWERELVFSREEIIHEIYEFRVAKGKLPTYADFSAPDPNGRRPSSRTIERLFGSWNGALVAAGYEPPCPRRSSRSYRAGIAVVTKAAA